jgi:hypothetical protein
MVTYIEGRAVFYVEHKTDKEDAQILKEPMSLREIIREEADGSSMFCDDMFDD